MTTRAVLYVVSLNTNDFPPTGSFAGIRYLVPQDFLNELYELYEQHPDNAILTDFKESGYRFP